MFLHSFYGRKPIKGLSGKERAVLALMARGFGNRRIGAELCRSADTIKTHSRNICIKLGARNRTHAVGKAAQAGLLNDINLGDAYD